MGTFLLSTSRIIRLAPCIFFTANEIHFICWGKYELIPTTFTKNTTEIRNNPPEKVDAAKTGLVTQAREKGPGDLQK